MGTKGQVEILSVNNLIIVSGFGKFAHQQRDHVLRNLENAVAGPVKIRANIGILSRTITEIILMNLGLEYLSSNMREHLLMGSP